MKKVYQYSFGATTFCQSVNEIGGYGKIDFAIKIRKNTQTGVISATLQVLETIDRANGYYQNTNSASIETYTAKDSSTFIVDMLKYFNVASKREDGLLKKEIQNEEINSIIARKKYEELLKNVSNDKIEAINKDLYFKRMKILDKSSIGKKIKIELESETYKINGWFVKEGMPGYYRYLNQILDGLVEMHSAEALQDVAFMAAWRKTAENASVELARVILSVEQSLVKNAEATIKPVIVEQQTQAKQNAQSTVEVKPNAAMLQKQQDSTPKIVSSQNQTFQKSVAPAPQKLPVNSVVQPEQKENVTQTQKLQEKDNKEEKMKNFLNNLSKLSEDEVASSSNQKLNDTLKKANTDKEHIDDKIKNITQSLNFEKSEEEMEK